MAKYECRICGYEFDEQQAKESFENLYSCPICDADKSSFVLTEEDPKEEPEESVQENVDSEEFIFEDAEETLENSDAATDNVATEVEETKNESGTTSTEEEPRETFEDFLKKIEEQTDEELKQAEENKESVKSPEEEKREAIYETIFTVKTDFPEETSEKDFIDELLESSDYVAKPTSSNFTIEKRQEFWKRDEEPVVTEKEQEEKEENAYAGLSHLGSVQKVIGGEAEEDKAAEDNTVKESPAESNGIIQTFYSFSKPVKTEEELKAEEEARQEKENAAFKPFFGSGMGTIQKVVGQTAEEEEFVFEET